MTEEVKLTKTKPVPYLSVLKKGTPWATAPNTPPGKPVIDVPNMIFTSAGNAWAAKTPNSIASTDLPAPSM